MRKPCHRAQDAAGSGGCIRRAEWRWVARAAAVLLALASVPYAVGYLAQSPQSVFSGAVFDRMDFSHHLGGIWLGLRGEWQFQLLNTADPHPPIFARLFYLALGHLARLLHLPAPAAFHLARFAWGAAALAAVYWLSALCFRAIALRRKAFLLFGLGSGLGWLQLLTGALPRADISPIDFWLIDGYGFFTLLTFPHLAAVTALATAAAIGGVRLLQEGGTRDWMLACGALLALQAIQPFAPAIVGTALLLDVVLRLGLGPRPTRRALISLVSLGVSQMPYQAYQLWVVTSHPVWRSFVEQNVTLSPPALYYLLGYGILGPLAVWGGWIAARRRDRPFLRLAVAWAAGCFLLAYLPVPIQRRFTETVMVPIAILATAGLAEGLFPWLRRYASHLRRGYAPAGWRRLRRQAMALSVAIASLSSLYLALGSALWAASRPAGLFDSKAVVAAADWLGAAGDWQTPVLAAEATGSLLVGRIGHRVLLGHPIETADYARRSAEVAAFFSPATSDEDRIDLLQACGCGFVFYGPAERGLGDWDPTRAPFLQPVFRRGGVTVFRFEP